MAGDSNAEQTSGGGGSSSTNECEKMIQRSLRDPTVKFLKEQLEKSGCGIGSNFIKGYTCKKAIAGGFSPTAGVGVCCNHLKEQEQVTQLVIHQLIYAYDFCRAANLDLNNCAHYACIEIRAGRLRGDCHYKRELARGFLKLRGHEQECLRRRVLQFLAANPNCSEIGAKDAMEAVWDICYNDTKPFDRAP
ncbi:Ku70-binding family protein [Perilla frutescens var. hirtella]|uniref:Mitochondrial inner membrane protease ATP23 n=1 Tax=Perilla frutescens var. hirtella TaxID=608512 RepID=A0AAD4NXH3_PERFH|nr:Ku70-binding family protein [Perilla frutescens var. hirtella]KAH6796749.1 Ku70-binding family protein [Perilla frutescens var. hirtella]